MKYILFIIFLGCISTSSAQVYVQVLGTSHSNFPKEQVYFYTYHLGIKNISIIVQYSHRLPSNIQANTQFEKTSFGDRALIKINKKISLKKQAYALAHEMIHVQQYALRQLQVISESKVIWQKQVYTNAQKIAYQDRKWEKEALKWEKNLYHKFLKTQKKANKIEILTMKQIP